MFKHGASTFRARLDMTYNGAISTTNRELSAMGIVAHCAEWPFTVALPATGHTKADMSAPWRGWECAEYKD